MALFNADGTFNTLGAASPSSRVGREITNLAAGLTELKQNPGTAIVANPTEPVDAGNLDTIDIGGSIFQIPGGMGGGGEANVQSSWLVTDTASDAYIIGKPNLATVATSGSYTDLLNPPTIPPTQVPSNWDASSGVARILNKPIVHPNAMGVPPTATASDLTHILIDHGNLRLGHKTITHDGTSLSVTAPEYVASNYIGSFQYPDDAGQRANGAFIFSYAYRRFYQYVGATFTWAQTNPPGNSRLIIAATRDAADQLVQSVGDFIYVINDFSRIVRRVTQFTPEMPQQSTYDWQPLQEIQALEARPVLPMPTMAAAGTAAVVSPDGSAYILAPLFSGSYPDLTNKPTIPDAVGRANVYTQVKDIIIGGANITAAENDTAQTVTLAGAMGGTALDISALPEETNPQPDYNFVFSDTDVGNALRRIRFDRLEELLRHDIMFNGQTLATSPRGLNFQSEFQGSVLNRVVDVSLGSGIARVGSAPSNRDDLGKLSAAIDSLGSDFMRYHGDYDSTVTYVLSDVVSLPVTGEVPLLFVCDNPTLANANAPASDLLPILTGWQSLTRWPIDEIKGFARDVIHENDYHLIYGIGLDATSQSTDRSNYIGNIYEAATDLTLRGGYVWMVRASGAVNNVFIRGFRGVVERNSAISYTGAIELLGMDIRNLSAPTIGNQSRYRNWQHETLAIHDQENQLEFRYNEPLHVRAGEHFVIGVYWNPVSVNPPLISGLLQQSLSAGNEDSHIGVQNFPFDTISAVARAGTSGGLDLAENDAAQWYNNTSTILKQQLFYDTHQGNLLRIDQGGTQVYLGPSHINFTGPGVSVAGNTITVSSGMGGGATTFLGLTDTPPGFGEPGQIPSVNATRTGMIFVDPAMGGGSTDAVVPWAVVGNVDRIPLPKMPILATADEMRDGGETAIRSMSPLRVHEAVGAVARVIDVTEFGYDVATNLLRLDYRHVTVSSAGIPSTLTTQDTIALPAWSLETDIEDWALTENPGTDVPDQKLNPDIMTGISSLQFNPSSRELQANWTRANSLTSSANVQLPNYLIRDGGGQEYIRDTIGSAFREGTGIEIGVSDANDTITISNLVGQEQVEDWIDGLINAGTGLSKTYDDATGVLQFSLDAAAIRGITATQIISGVGIDVRTVNNGANLEILATGMGTPGGPTTFIGATDTPAVYGTPGQVPIVNASRDGLLFADQSGGPGGGGGTPVPPEVLFNNVGGVGLTADLATRSWAPANTINMPLSRALVEEDDDKLLIVDLEYVTTTSPKRVASLVWRAGRFRLLGANTLTSGGSIPDHIPYYMERNNNATVTTWGEMAVIFTRARLGTGEDQIRVAFATNRPEDINAWFATVRLVTVSSSASGGGASAFVDLTDTPALLGPAGSLFTVNAAGDALEFIPAASLTLNTEGIQDIVGAMLVAGTNATVNYDDSAGTVTIGATGGSGSGVTLEQVQDNMATFLVGGNGISTSYSDSGNRLTLNGISETQVHAFINSDVLGFAQADRTERVPTTKLENSVQTLISRLQSASGTQFFRGDGSGNPPVATSINEAIDDRVGNLLIEGSGIDLTYSDQNGTLRVTATAEHIQDVVGAMITAGSNVIVDYNDGAGTLEISATGGMGGGVTIEQVDDRVANLLQEGTGVTLDYDDSGNTLTISAVPAAPDLTSITGDILPAISFSGNVGTEVKTWNKGWFNDFRVEGALEVRGNISLLDNDQITFGSTGFGAPMAYSAPFQRLILGLSANQPGFAILDGTTNRFDFHRDGAANFGGRLTVEDLTVGSKTINEYIDDQVDILIVPGTNITTDYDDTAGTLTIASTAMGGGSSIDRTDVLLGLGSGGRIDVINTLDPSQSFQAGSIDISGFDPDAAFTINDFVYATEDASRQVIRAHISDLFSWSNVGTLPSGNSAHSMATDGSSVYLWASRSLRQVTNLSTFGSVASRGSLPSGSAAITGFTYHNGAWLAVDFAGQLINVNTTNANSSTNIGSGIGAAIAEADSLISHNGSLYCLGQRTSGGQTLRSVWLVDSITGSGTRIGDIATSVDIEAGVSVELPLSTSFIPEGRNLYYTDARADARIGSWAKAFSPSGTAPVARLGTGTPSATTFLRGDGAWATPTGMGGGASTWIGLTDTPSAYGSVGQAPIVNAGGDGLEFAALFKQSDADARYLQLTGGTIAGSLTVNTPSGTGLSIDGTDSGNSTIMHILTPSTQQQKAFGATREGQTWDWVQFAGNLAGVNQPGLALGTGAGSRDTNLYRGGANRLETDDAFYADSLHVTGTLSTTQTALGIPSNADIDGRVASWARATGATGTAPADRLGTGNANQFNWLRGDGVWSNVYDWHNALGVEATSLDDNDRFYFTDQDIAGNPVRYQTWQNIRADTRNEIASWAWESGATGKAPADRLPDLDDMNGSVADSQIPSSIARDSEIPEVRTVLFDPDESGAGGGWTTAAGGSDPETTITVGDIDNHKYITISLWANTDSMPKTYATATIRRVDIGAIPDSAALPENTAALSIVGEGNAEGNVGVTRNAAGTQLRFFVSSTSAFDTGQIVGVWGGPF